MDKHACPIGGERMKPLALFIDGCAANRFALVNLDPFRAIAGSGVGLALTPALEAEYRAALDHLFVPSYVKALLRKLIEGCEPIPADIAEHLPLSADAQLAALARTALVVTDDGKLYRRWIGESAGLIAWPTVEAHVKSDGRLLDLLLEHAALLPASGQPASGAR